MKSVEQKSFFNQASGFFRELPQYARSHGIAEEKSPLKEYPKSEIINKMGVSSTNLNKILSLLEDNGVGVKKKKNHNRLITPDNISDIRTGAVQLGFKEEPRTELCSVYASIANKGGVGKTTLCVNLSSLYAEKALFTGEKVALIDMDKQANASQHTYFYEEDVYLNHNGENYISPAEYLYQFLGGHDVDIEMIDPYFDEDDNERESFEPSERGGLSQTSLPNLHLMPANSRDGELIKKFESIYAESKRLWAEGKANNKGGIFRLFEKGYDYPLEAALLHAIVLPLMKKGYRYIFIDTPPGLDVITNMVYYTANNLVVTFSPRAYEISTFSDLMENFGALASGMHDDMFKDGIEDKSITFVSNMHDRGAEGSKENLIYEALKEKFPDCIAGTKLRKTSAVQKLALSRQTVATINKKYFSDNNLGKGEQLSKLIFDITYVMADLDKREISTRVSEND